MNSSAGLQLNPYDPGLWMQQAPEALGATSAAAALYEYILQVDFPKSAKVLELGSGSGVISILLALARPEWEITGIELQEELHRLSQLNARDLKLPIDFIKCDLRSYQAPKPYDLIFANPPWQELGKGLLSPNPLRAISRSEVSCSMDDVFGCITRNLSPQGQAVLLYPASRAREAASKASIANLKLRHPEAQPSQWSILNFTKG